MFGSKKKSPAAPTSPARVALIEADRALTAARERVAGIEVRITRLRGLVDADAPAQTALHHAVAADGGASLVALAAGKPAEAMGDLVAAAENAAKAARAAAGALPKAQAEEADAAAAVTRLERVKQLAVVDLLLEEANAVAGEYIARFREMAKLHDRLAGVRRAIITLGGADIANVEGPMAAVIEAPRFNLPATPSGPHWSPYHRHVPSEFDVDRAAKRWAQAGEALAADVTADIQPLISAKPIVGDRQAA